MEKSTAEMLAQAEKYIESQGFHLIVRAYNSFLKLEQMKMCHTFATNCRQYASIQNFNIVYHTCCGPGLHKKRGDISASVL